jgi:DeoR family fructose operon transcriptional repressor
MKMLAETRRRTLLDLIARQGFATLDELVKALAVSESTVRRDLEALDLGGQVKRTHGGAVYAGEVRALPAFEDRTATATAEKQAIGRTAATLLDDGDTVLLDGGTTTLEVARALLGRPLQVVTNSLPIAQLLAASTSIDLILIGGYVYPRTGVALGPLAIATMQGIRVGTAILGAGGIVAEGIYNHNLLLVETERQMMACGRDVWIVADHTKFGRQALARLCGMDEVGRLVVDTGLPDDYRTLAEAAGVRIHVASTASSSSTEDGLPPVATANGVPVPRSESSNLGPRSEA